MGLILFKISKNAKCDENGDAYPNTYSNIVRRDADRASNSGGDCNSAP
jgi:hypothetical protein